MAVGSGTRTVPTRWLAAFLVGATAACSSRQPTLSPTAWPAGDVAAALQRTAETGKPKPVAEGTKGMVTGTTGAFAVRAGREALRQGGSAIDAALTTSLTQIALAAGSWVSYAGFMNLIYYDAATKTVHSMNAGFNTIKGETDPATIPACLGAAGMVAYPPSGRTALVPGYLAGVEAAHRRFGKLPFRRLFEPAIWLADSGFVLPPMPGAMLQSKKAVLERRPETRRVFFKDDGTMYRVGDRFRQPALAATLRQVAARGTDYIYRGEWARQLVAAVREDGGRMTLEDLADYRVQWAEPIRSQYRGYQLYGAAWPTFGAIATLEALRTLEHVDLPNGPKYWESAETLYPMLAATQIQAIAGPPGGGPGVPDGWAQKRFPNVDLSTAGRLSQPTADFWWSQLRDPATWQAIVNDAGAAQRAVMQELSQARGGGDHSDAVVAVDERGNVAAITHTINTALYGGTGINVGGISIPDAACFQQDLIRRTGPGKRLPDPTNPMIAMKDGEWILAGSGIGAGLLENALAVMVNVLDYGRDPHAALHAPQWAGANLQGPFMLPDADFPKELVTALTAKGGRALSIPKAQLAPAFGSWISILRDPRTGRLRGATRDQYNGAVEGY